MNRTLTLKQLKCLKNVIIYDISEEKNDFENYVHDTYGSEEGHKFAELNNEERIKYIEDVKKTHHIYYSLLVLQDLL